MLYFRACTPWGVCIERAFRMPRRVISVYVVNCDLRTSSHHVSVEPMEYRVIYVQEVYKETKNSVIRDYNISILPFKTLYYLAG